jgi:hypothetical protein
MSRILPYLFPVLLILLAALFGCKTSRQLIKAPIKEEGVDYLLKKLKENEAQFDDFSARFSASLIQDKKDRMGFSGQIRIRRDSLIWVSLSPALNIEAMRVMVSQDSIFLLNRLNKTYFKAGFDYVNSFINAALDYDMLQALLIGNDFAFYEIGEFRASIDGMQYRLNTSNRQKIKKYIRANEHINTIPLQTIWLDPETFKISRIMIKELEVEGRKLNAAYSDFEPVNERVFPGRIQVEVNAEKHISLDMRYTRLETNQGKAYPFHIPGSYQALQ